MQLALSKIRINFNRIIVNSKQDTFGAQLAWFASLFYAVWLFMPQVKGGLGARGGLFAILLFYIGIVLDKSFFNKYYKEIVIRTLGLIILPTFIGIFMREGSDLLLYVPQTAMFFFPAVIAFYIKKKNTKKQFYGIAFVVMICVFLTCSSTITWLSAYPGTSRSLGFGGADPVVLRRAMGLGIGGFDFIYCLPIYSIYLLAWGIHDRNIIYRICCMLMLIPVSLCLYHAEYFIALFLLSLAIFSFIIIQLVKIPYKLKKKEISISVSFLAIIISLLILYISRFIILDLFIDLFNLAGVQTYIDRISAIESIFLQHTIPHDLNLRIKLYIEGIKTFIWSPGIGRLADNTILPLSGHSDIIDLFASSGLLGAVPFFGVLYYLVKDTYKNVLSKPFDISILAMLIFFIITGVLNTLTYSPQASYILGLFPLYADNTLLPLYIKNN